MELQTALFLFPVNISEAPLTDVLPAGNTDILRHISHFIVENIRTARRFIKKAWQDADISSMTFYELNEHTRTEDISSFLNPLREGIPMGLMSEAGCPAVADPGAAVVRIAQQERLKVVPLTGPSSILLSLMGSGFNGQGFSFNGYLPIDRHDRIRRLQELENICSRHHVTQIFIEAPYRNNRMIEFLAQNLRKDTLLCVACDITDPLNESIITKKAEEWKNCKVNYDKRPAIFLIHRP